MKKQSTVNNKSVFNIGYHFIWYTKDRSQALVGNIASRLETLLDQRANQFGMSIEQKKIIPDSVHLFLKSEPLNSPEFIVQMLKGYTSLVLQEEFKVLESFTPTLWTDVYFCKSISCASSEDAVKQFIMRNQKNNEIQ